MSLRNLFRRQQREVKRHGVMVQPPVQAAQALPQVKMTVSQETLALLVQGYNSLVQRRQQLVQQVQEVDIYLQKQQGGIETMQQLLAAQVAGDAGAQPTTQE